MPTKETTELTEEEMAELKGTLFELREEGLLSPRHHLGRQKTR